MAGKYEDLGITQDKDGDYFDVIIPNLDLGTEYDLQVAWVYSDKTLGISPYSDPYTFVTTSEQPLNKPRFLQSDLTTQLNALIVNWSGLDYLGAVYPSNFARVDVFVKGGTFGSDYVLATSFFKAGKKTIIAQEGAYSVKLRAVSNRGTVSDFSDEWSVNTSDPAEIIEPPTLPVGLTVSSTAFGISVNWGGAYQADDPFSGFKTIEVYATTNAALGANTTTAFASSALVANLTVTQSLNRQNVGIDNLKQALGLATSKEVYEANIYFYYIAYNKNNEPYKVSGVPTYTRISATPLSPTQANLIDLANGLISIENLKAGNGKFTSWLRAGSDANGARIELNGGAAFTNVGETHQVLPGLSVYATGGNPIFRADLSGTIKFGGYSPADLDLIKSTGESKATVFRESYVPTAIAKGDIWINTFTNQTTSIIAAVPTDSPPTPAYEGKNTIYVASAPGKAYWVVSKDTDILLALQKAGGFDSNGNINRGIEIPLGAGAIYSAKNSYASTTSGWFLGWSGTTANSVPVINIGNDNYSLKWTGTELQIKGNITATSGYIGSASNGWNITDYGISAVGDFSIISLDNGGLISLDNGGIMSFGNAYLTADDNQFKIYDADGTSIFSVPTTGGRVLLGNLDEGIGRQVEVARSAQIAGDSAGSGARNSGGLRNMYTATVQNFLTYPNMYLSDRPANGDVLLLWS
jgi:hypothetical protein